eukprot:TRINITY_DN5524_c0_g3_i1.p1 TRINITY_DN5524_c0_g3~~TRINITY_DN5524_c0_g3_i1.p1  ORF type:complete len:500 (-),score=132.63 TRINITY_DN5524_c0_g3_i1:172-1671(-)
MLMLSKEQDLEDKSLTQMSNNDPTALVNSLTNPMNLLNKTTESINQLISLGKSRVEELSQGTAASNNNTNNLNNSNNGSNNPLLLQTPYGMSLQQPQGQNSFYATSASNSLQPNVTAANPNPNALFAPNFYLNGGNNHAQLGRFVTPAQLAHPQIPISMVADPRVKTLNGSSPTGPVFVNGAYYPGVGMATMAQAASFPTPAQSIVDQSTKNTLDTFLDEFQKKTMGLILSQNNMLVELRQKNESLEENLSNVMKELGGLKNMLKSNNNTASNNLEVQGPPRPTMIAVNPVSRAPTLDTASAESLLMHLYPGQVQPPYKYQLVLSAEFPRPLYRERNFKFNLKLIDMKGNRIENSNRITLNLALYNTENPPKFIETNTSGNKILKGSLEKELVNGLATFERIQIRDVTSHFRNGWLFIVVLPAQNKSASSFVANQNHNIVESELIKPLVIEKVVVKAKKYKEKGKKEEEEDIYEGECIKEAIDNCDDYEMPSRDIYTEK